MSATGPDASRRLPTAERIAAASLFLLALLLAARQIEDPDLPWHLATGRRILETGAVPRADELTLLAHGRPWIDTYWLAQAAMAAGVRAGGFVLLQLGTILATLAMVAVVRRGTRGHPIALPALLLALLAAAQRLEPRPDLAALLFPLLLIRLIERAGRAAESSSPEELPQEPGPRQDPAPAPTRTIALIGLLQVLWVNCHGSFVLGPLTALAYLGGALLSPRAAYRRGPLAAAATVTVAALGVNPWGFGVLRLLSPYVEGVAIRLGLLQGAPPPAILEWIPTLSSSARRIDPLGLVPYAVLLLLTAVALALGARRRALAPAAVLATFALISITGLRHVAGFAVVAALLVPPLLAARWPPRLVPLVSGATAAAALVLAAAVATNRYYVAVHNLGETGPGLREHTYPEGPCAWVEAAGITGQAFNNYTMGGWYVWRSAGRRLALADGRVDLLAPEEFRRLGAALADPQLFEQMAAEVGATHVILDYTPESWQLIPYLETARDRWMRAYADGSGVVYLPAGSAVPVATPVPLPPHPLDRAAARTLGWLRKLQVHVPQGHLDLARLAETGGDGDDAIADYEAALAELPDLVGVHAHLAALYLTKGERDRARTHVDWLERRAPGHPAIPALREALVRADRE